VLFGLCPQVERSLGAALELADGLGDPFSE
jgi:hypothetical protein